MLWMILLQFCIWLRILNDLPLNRACYKLQYDFALLRLSGP